MKRNEEVDQRNQDQKKQQKEKEEKPEQADIYASAQRTIPSPDTEITYHIHKGTPERSKKEQVVDSALSFEFLFCGNE